MKTLLSGMLLLGVFAMVTVINATHGETQEPVLYEYMIHNFEDDTAAHNAIAAILLNYRMYDTMFEALILLTAIIGMKQFLPGVKDLKTQELRARKRT